MEPLVDLWRSLFASPAGSSTTSAPALSPLTTARVDRTWKPKATATAKFYGPGTTLKFDRGKVESPLVYLSSAIAPEAPDASLIEIGLPVAKSGTSAEDLPYWPSYRASSPAQRSQYLNWLIEGRSAPDIPLGYVFIYFYGLERRVLVDRADHAAIASEVLRLLPIYSHSRSFHNYASKLLWTTIWLGLQTGSFPRALIETSLDSVGLNDDTVGTCLACFAQAGECLPDSLVYRLAEIDVRSPRSVVAQRHRELHCDLFLKRFRSTFPEGFRVRTGKRDRKLEYFPASATLGRLSDAGGPLAEERIPNVTSIASQFLPLVETWASTNEDLKAYNRAHRNANGEGMTAEMYEALPEDVREGDHPHFDAWYRIMDQSVTDDGWTVVSVGQFATLEDYPKRPKLTKSQSIALARTATHMGLAFEPDARITGQAYQWDEPISVFPATEELSEDVASYHAAAVLLELGCAIAAADGQIDESELGRLTSHLESQFQLSTQDSARLEHLRYLLTKHPPTEFSAAKTLRKNLTEARRRLVGEFLVGIAAVDEEITPDEVKALGKAYRALGLPGTDLQKVLEAIQPAAPTGTSATTFRLDLNRINAIMAETVKVTEYLRDALKEDITPCAEDSPEPVLPPPRPVPATEKPADPVVQPNPAVASDSRFADLDHRFVGFAELATRQSLWLRQDLEAIARSHGLMLGSAIDRINDWAIDRFNDSLLVDVGDQIEVQTQLWENHAS